MALSILLAAAGMVPAVLTAYLATVAVAAWVTRERRAGGVAMAVDPRGSAVSLTVLVPAYNESHLLRRCINSLHAQTYPRDLCHVVVIADNCTDDTAAIAASVGADVLVRHDPHARGKGQALRWALDRILADGEGPDGVVVVDADSVADPHLLARLAAHLEAGADAVQAEYLALEEDASPRSQLRSVAFFLFNRVRLAGRSALAMPCNLVGNGMAFSRSLLERHPWNAFSSTEDLELTVDLRLAGVSPVFAEGALVRGPLPGRGRALRAQRMRWAGGRLNVVRHGLPRLLVAAARRRDLRLLEVAMDLAVPPLGLLALLAASGTLLAAALAAVGQAAVWSVAPWLLAATAIATFVLVGLQAGRAPASAYRSLLNAPQLIWSEVLGSFRLLGGLGATTWQRTVRPNEEEVGG